jgi:hypothetical protein
MVRKKVEEVVSAVPPNYASFLCTPNIYRTGCLQKPADGSYLEVFVFTIELYLFFLY